jgi:hypothetical protein
MDSRHYPDSINIEKLACCFDMQGMNYFMTEENGGEKVLNSGYCPVKSDIVRDYRTTASGI